MTYLIPAILTIIVGLIVGLILWAIKRERFSLTYEIVKSEVFPRENTSGRYFVCTLRNTGNRPIENISYKFRVNDGTIETAKFLESQLIQLSAQDQNTLEGSIPLLNPKEQLGAVVTITNARPQSTSILEARAVGATARKVSTESIPGVISVSPVMILVSMLVMSLAAMGLGTLAAFISNQTKVSQAPERFERLADFAKTLSESSNENLEKLEEITTARQDATDLLEGELAQARPTREHRVFAILNRSGLGSILPALLSTGDQLPYWKTGLYLMHVYLTDKKNARKYVDALDKLSHEEDIFPSSRGFLLYLAGKIEQDQGNSKKAVEYLEKCKKETPLMYELLMAQDPTYDLRALERVVTVIVPNKPIKPTR